MGLWLSFTSKYIPSLLLLFSSVKSKFVDIDRSFEIPVTWLVAEIIIDRQDMHNYREEFSSRCLKARHMGSKISV